MDDPTILPQPVHDPTDLPAPTAEPEPGNSLEIRSAEEEENRKSQCEWMRKWRFQPGQSGNPSGRPKKKPVHEAIEKLMDMPYPPNQKRQMQKKIGIKLPKGFTFAQAIALGRMLEAVVETGTFAAVVDRSEGPVQVQQKLEVTGNDSAPRVQPILITQFVSVGDGGERKIIKVVKTPHPAQPNGNGLPEKTKDDDAPDS